MIQLLTFTVSCVLLTAAAGAAASASANGTSLHTEPALLARSSRILNENNNVDYRCVPCVRWSGVLRERVFTNLH
jgi:hypothetical protein